MWLYYHLAIYRSRSFVGFRDQRAQARPNLLPLPRCRYAFLRAHDRRPQPAGVRLDVPAGRSTPFFVVLHCTTCGKLNSACGDRSIKKAPKICCFSPSSIARRKTSGPWLCKIWCSRWEREVSGRHSPSTNCRATCCAIAMLSSATSFEDRCGIWRARRRQHFMDAYGAEPGAHPRQCTPSA